MVLYYAVGGGLGHLTRARAVVHTLGLDEPITVVSSLAHGALPKAFTKSVPDTWCFEAMPTNPTRESARCRVQELVDRLKPRRMVIDAFPGGILGELCDLRWPSTLERIHLARLLHWSRYRRRLLGELPVFAKTLLLEPLTDEHRQGLEHRSRTMEPITLADPPSATPELPNGEWLVVHSQPVSEILELVAYAEQVKKRRDPDAALRLISPCRPSELPEHVAHASVYPAWPLFRHARHVVSACGFNTMRQTRPIRHKHSFLPFERALDDQFERARRRRKELATP